MFQPELVDVGVAPQRECHEVEMKLEEQQDAGLVQELHLLGYQLAEGREKLVSFTVTEVSNVRIFMKFLMNSCG